MNAEGNQRFVIKVCGITNATDAVSAAEAGATAVGLNFYPRSPRYISSEQAAEVSAALPRPVWRVGIFVNPHWDDMARVAAAVPLDVVQVHGILQGTGTSLRLWKALSVDHRFRPENLSFQDAEAYLLDAPTAAFGGSGKSFDWSRVNASSMEGASARYLVAGGLDGSNVAAAIAALAPWGVDACSLLESRPGKKDTGKVREFVDAALQAFEALDAKASKA
jgi:phosphoribosylanthranilate isomerase